MKIRTLDKAARNLIALDTARCNGNWQEVPELLGKIAKRSPAKKCLIQTARAECRIAEHIGKGTRSRHSSTEATDHGLLELIPTLLSAMQEEGSSPQDIFQAQVCLGWLHWSLSEPALASSRLPRDFEETLGSLSADGQALSPWTEVCVIKAGYIKASAQASTSKTNDALQTLSTISNWASEAVEQSTPQHAFWSEQFLAKSALIASDAVKSQEIPEARTVDFALTSFRAWASHPEVKRADPASSGEGSMPGGPGSRPFIWKAYYEFLSLVIQRRLPFTAPTVRDGLVQLASEFRGVEAVCENILLRTVKFPRAHVQNHLVEEWVEQVIRNWEVLCGPEWCDDDLGEGGQDGVSRNVLDILYRAATKTFHSTLILRRLFHVHSALAEFDLAMKAFDTYLDLVTNANRRAEQSGKRLGSLEDEETFIRTLSQGITLLCCYGSRKEAERANQLSGQLHEALSSLTEPDRTESLSESSVAPDEVYRSKHGTDVSVSVVSAAYQAVGVGLANWARWTPVNESRTAIQESAATAFEKSLEIDSDHGSNASTSFALGLLLAEMRDVDGAIDSVRSALIQTSETDDVPSTPLVTYSEGHNLLSLWHLLVLLLSARQEFELAEKVCETATSEVSIQQALRLPSVYEGSEDGRANALNMGVYDTKFRQKEILVELRMTQLAITEVLHGPEAALNRSDELFSLFAALFKGLGVTEKEETPKSERLAPPKTSSGKSRSFRGSIFSRRKNQQPGDRASHTTSSGSVKDRSSSGSHTAPDTPAIQVTKEEAGASDEPHSPETGDRTPQKLHRRQASLAKLVKEQSSAPSSALPSPARSQHVKDEPDIRSSTVGERVSPTAGHDVSPGARQALPPVPHNMKHTKEPFPAGHATQPPKQDIRLPPPSTHFQGPTNAVTLFPRLQARKHAQGLLIKVWLFISGLYRRASLFDDACEALHEASEQATRVELLVAEQESSARALAAAGWGGAKSSDELWADVFAEAGLLAEAQSQPYDAISQFEEALMYWPDHARATVGLANLLLSIYDETLSPERPETEADADISGSSPTSTLKPDKSPNEPPVSGSSQKETPEKLNRLAARDRAYGLLSALTKLGSAWDDSEAWFALSKAYERSGQVERAKEILWWCVELEDRRPVRHWWSINSGGYVL